MDRTKPARPPRMFGPVRAATMALFVLLLVSGPAFAGCSDAHPASADGSAAAMPTMHPPAAPVDATEAVWAVRPDYVRADALTELAYAFALQHPEIVQWMPCYCGCDAMGHGSNLDCYFKHGVVGMQTAYEEHASFCNICVQITLKAKQLNSAGESLSQIRQTIDQTFGGSGGTGTDTPQPPA